MPDYTDIRNKEINTNSGTDVRDTQQLKGEAKGSTPASNAKNSTSKEYSSGSTPAGALGGKPSRK